MRQQMMGFSNGSGISWTICKQSAPRSRQITTCSPTPHHSIFTDRVLLMTTNQQRQSTESIVQCGIKQHTLSSSEHASWCKCHTCDIYCINHTNCLTYVIQKCLRSTSDLRSLVRGRNSVFTTAVVQDQQKVVTWLRRSPVIIRGQQWLDLDTDTTLSASQHNTTYTMFSWTFLEVFLNVHLTFIQSITQTTGKLFVFWMYWMMPSQFICCIETLWTFTANIRLHSFMSLNVDFDILFAAEFLLTNVTREPRTFIVWLQQMCLELIKSSKTVWTVSTWVRLCISVNTNMTLQFNVNLKQFPTVRTFIRSTVAVYTTFM